MLTCEVADTLGAVVNGMPPGVGIKFVLSRSNTHKFRRTKNGSKENSNSLKSI